MMVSSFRLPGTCSLDVLRFALITMALVVLSRRVNHVQKLDQRIDSFLDLRTEGDRIGNRDELAADWGTSVCSYRPMACSCRTPFRHIEDVEDDAVVQVFGVQFFPAQHAGFRGKAVYAVGQGVDDFREQHTGRLGKTPGLGIRFGPSMFVQVGKYLVALGLVQALPVGFGVRFALKVGAVGTRDGIAATAEWGGFETNVP